MQSSEDVPGLNNATKSKVGETITVKTREDVSTLEKGRQSLLMCGLSVMSAAGFTRPAKLTNNGVVKIIRILRTKSIWIMLAIAGTLSLSAIACSAELAEPHDPFTMRTNYAELTGYTDGFMLGNTYEFELSIRNDASGPWQGRYCMFLVDDKEIVLQIEGEDFDLQPAGGLSRTVQMTVPENFKEGAYGLTLLVPDRGASVTTIRIGGNTLQAAGPFLHVSSCPE